ncbi:hypothetical protein [Mesobacillus harenae]|uniref:YqgU-like beta propeller domain-containing protein n=1 Tax=Mesobacillus harenae TaxID=2213203 RepID=UPI0015810E00|nr:hypothetical protein [Mesobacillus harenae]
MHFKKIGKRQIKIFLIMFLILASAALVLGCSKETLPSLHSKKQFHSAPRENPGLFLAKTIAPFNSFKGDFYQASGWVDNETLLFITNQSQSSYIYSHHIITGESMLIFESETPIVAAEISPSKSHLLVHSAPSTYLGKLTVTDIKGNESFSTTMDSYELSYTWNPYKEEEILISAFGEDWQFRSYILNHKKETVSEVFVPEPFPKWQSKDELVYLDWGENDPTLFAPLVLQSVSEQQGAQIKSDIFGFDRFKDILLTITIKDDKQEEAQYTLFNQDLNQVSSFKAPHLSRFSGWLIPYYDYIPVNSRFIYLEPKHSADADVYNDGFTLVSFDISAGEKEEVMSGLENEPLNCSPDGSLCLYGFQFERLLDLQQKEWYNLIE